MNMLINRRFISLPKRLPPRFFSTVKYRVGISLIVFVFILSIGVIFFIYPQRQDLARLVIEEATIDTEIRSKQNRLNQQQKSLELHQHLQHILSAFYINKPDYLITTQLITQIEQWTKQQGLKLEKVTLGKLKSQEHLTIQPVNLHFTGTYNQLMFLFQYFGERFAVLDIIEFTMQKQNSQVSPYISLELEVHIVILKASLEERA